MAHQTRVRLNLAAWAPGTTVTDVEFDALDNGQFESINGDDGGTWAPAAAIQIGGSGLDLTSATNYVSGAARSLQFRTGSDLVIGDAANVSSLVVMNLSTLSMAAGSTFQTNATAPSTFNGTVTCANTTTVNNGAKFELTAGADFDLGDGALASVGHVENFSTLYIDNGATLTCSNGSTVNIQGGSTFTISGTNGLTTPLVCSATGNVRQRLILGADAHTHYDIGDADIIHVLALTADQTYTLDAAGAGNGDMITFSTAVIGFKIAVASGLQTVDLKYAAGNWYSATFVYSTAVGDWFILERHSFDV